MRRTTLILPWLICLYAACGGDGPSGPKLSGELRIEPAELAFDALYKSSGVTVYFGDASTTKPAMQITSEARWLHDFAVVDEDSLALGRIHATAPGTAQLTVSAFNQSATLSVSVQPSGSVVMQIIGNESVTSTDVITLRGYRLDEDIGAITFAGTAATMIEQDSAHVRLRFHDVVPPGECGIVTDTIRVPGAQIITSLARHRINGTPFSLEIGEAVTPTSDDLSCMILPAGTRYALAYYDAVLLERARTGYESREGVGDWGFSITPSGQSGPSARTFAKELDHVSDILQLTGSQLEDPTAPHMRAAPWTLGEVSTLSPAPGFAEARDVRIHRIYDGHYVLALEEGIGGDTANAIVQIFDSIMPAFLRETVPLYQSVFSDGLPVTSVAADQFLILIIRSPCFPGFAIEREDAAATRSLSWTALGSCYLSSIARPGDFPEIDRLFNHEMAHVWSFMYAYEQLGTRGLGGSIWGLEGVAELMRQEVVRRRLDIGLLSNYDARGRTHQYALAVMHDGVFSSGYQRSASFLRDLVARRMLKGESYESALRDVGRGAVDGWYGFTSCCDEWWSGHAPAGWMQYRDAPLDARLPGLVSRMQAVDPTWDPAHAVLLWTMGHAIDDLTDNPELQVHSFLHAVPTAVALAGGQRTWQPDIVVTPASGTQGFGREAGSSGYSYLLNDSGAGVYRIDAAHDPRFRWLLARY